MPCAQSLDLFTRPIKFGSRWNDDQGDGVCAGESSNPQGVQQTSLGLVFRAYHKFTLVDQSNRGQCISKPTSERPADQEAINLRLTPQVDYTPTNSK